MTMDNVQIIKIENSAGELIEHVIIDRGNGEFTSMPKSVWDELEAAKEAQSL
jgi:acyl-CoA thioesterase FadM